MTWTRSKERRIMQAGFYAVGIGIVIFFAYSRPDALNPQWVAVIGLMFAFAGFSVAPKKGPSDDKPKPKAGGKSTSRTEEVMERIRQRLAEAEDDDVGRDRNSRRRIGCQWLVHHRAG